MSSPPVRAVERSANAKLSDPHGAGMSATYVTQASCPSSCALRGAGCYAEHGALKFTTYKVNAAPIATPIQIAHAEAAAIARLSGWRRLRVHVVGDCRTPPAARIIGQAMRDHTARHGRAAWTYTHSWRTIARKDWQGASVLASCETPDQARQARARGYPVALVVPEHQSRQIYRYHGLRVLPCPAQFKTRGEKGTHCERCQICARPDELRRRRLVLGFADDQHRIPR